MTGQHFDWPVGLTNEQFDSYLEAATRPSLGTIQALELQREALLREERRIAERRAKREARREAKRIRDQQAKEAQARDLKLKRRAEDAMLVYAVNRSWANRMCAALVGIIES